MSERREAAAALTAWILGFCPLGCTADYYTRDADREVGGILAEYQQQGLSDRASRVIQPEPAKPEPTVPADEPDAAADDAAAEEAPAPAPSILDLERCLSIAVHEGRQFKSEKENLYLAGLNFSFTKFQYGPQFTSAVSYLWGDAEGSPASSSTGASLGVSQLLPTNGSLSLAGGITKSWQRDDFGAADDWSTNSGISLTQPLLRNAGYDIYRETLTQAERNMIYSVRDFELFREQFTIDIAAQFFSLVGQKRQITNTEHDLESAIFDQEKSEALRAVEWNTDADVIQTRRRRLEVESSLADQRANYRRAVQRFLIDLGMDPNTPVDLVATEPPFEKIDFDPALATEVAMHNRLDVQTARERNEDAERNFVLARNDLLPDLNLNANYGSDGSGRHPGTALPDRWNRSIGLSLEIPIQTIDRRNAWRQAEISIDRTRRDWDQFVDSVKSQVEDQIRQLKTLERQIDIAEQSIVDEERNVFRLEAQLERGTISSRDLVESRQKLIEQRNGLIEQRVQHLIGRLGLYRNLGLLFIDENGKWSLGTPAASGEPAPFRLEDGR